MISCIHKHVHGISFISCTSVFAFAYATWHSCVLVGLHSDNPRHVCPEFGARMIVKSLLLTRVCSGSVASLRIGTWCKLGDLVADPPDTFPLISSRESFPAHEHLPGLYLVNLL